MGWYVLSKYYNSSDEAPAYGTALLLHPMHRKKYITTNWEPSWVNPALDAVRKIWATYKELPLEDGDNQEEKDNEELSEFDKLAQSLDVTRNNEEEDEFERFVNATPYKITC